VVHDKRVAVGVLLVSLLVGCVIPPSLSVDNQDAGANSPPAITAVRSEQEALAEPGPLALVRDEGGSLSIELLDTDLLDTLYVRVFVNYTVDEPTPARANCTASPTQTPKRTVTCDLTALCTTQDDNLQRNMTVVAFDREPLESGEPFYQAMPPGGLSTSKFFFLNCTPPQPL
jgi:hypothetical protein